MKQNLRFFPFFRQARNASRAAAFCRYLVAGVMAVILAGCQSPHVNKDGLTQLQFSYIHYHPIRKLVERDIFDPTRVGDDGYTMTIAKTDLNLDGLPDYLAYTTSSFTCNQKGCEIGIYMQPERGRYVRVPQTIIGEQNIWLSTDRPNGMFGLYVAPRGKPHDLWVWNGETYDRYDPPAVDPAE